MARVVKFLVKSLNVRKYNAKNVADLAERSIEVEEYNESSIKSNQKKILNQNSRRVTDSKEDIEKLTSKKSGTRKFFKDENARCRQKVLERHPDAECFVVPNMKECITMCEKMGEPNDLRFSLMLYTINHLEQMFKAL